MLISELITAAREPQTQNGQGWPLSILGIGVELAQVKSEEQKHRRLVVLSLLKSEAITVIQGDGC